MKNKFSKARFKPGPNVHCQSAQTDKSVSCAERTQQRHYRDQIKKGSLGCSRFFSHSSLHRHGLVTDDYMRVKGARCVYALGDCHTSDTGVLTNQVSSSLSARQ